MDPHGSPPRSSIERLETTEALDGMLDRLEPVVAGAGRGRLGDALQGRWLGHALHPVLTDLPIGCWTSAALLDVLGGRRSRRAAQRLIGLGLACVPPTVATGVSELAATSDRRVKRVGSVHAVGNGIATLAYLCSWRARRRGAYGRGVLWGFVGGATASVAGYLGGHMAFARGAGQGSRAQASTGPARERLIDAREAADLLDVDPAQLDELVDAQLLVPVRGAGNGAAYDPADVLAVRLVGG